MSDRDRFFMLMAMRTYGGGFVATLAEAWDRADAVNAAKLEAAFPELVGLYGPGSTAFEKVRARGVAA